MLVLYCKIHVARLFNSFNSFCLKKLYCNETPGKQFLGRSSK